MTRFRRAALLAGLSLFAHAPGQSAPLGEILEDLKLEGYSLGLRPTYLGTVGGRAVFQNLFGEPTTLVWITDGTSEGTFPLAIGQRDDNSPALTYLGTAGLHLFLYLRDQGSESNDLLLAIDAQGEVTRVLQESDGWDLTYLADTSRHRVAGSSLAILAWNQSSPADVLSFIDGNTLARSAVYESPAGGVQLLGALGSQLVFSVADYPTLQETLWKSAGSAATTAPYATLSGQVIGAGAAAANSVVYFTLTEPGEAGNEVWTTNGSSGGSVRLTALADPSAQVGIFHLDGDRAFFSVNDASFGQELFASDATPAGTRAVTAFGYHLPFSDGEARIEIVGGKAYFIATDGVAANRLWSAGSRPEELRSWVENVAFDYSQGFLAAAGGSVFVPTADDQGGTHLF
ncbi:MAG: hypothetical protein ABIU84_14520, partial [Thermoanaerobaculia bacterium]